MLRNEGERLTRVVVCTPRYEYARAGSLEEHNIGELGDPKVAVQQHDELKSKLREFGAEVTDLPELVGHPNSVFTRDTALCTPKGYVKLRLGLESRQGEEEWMAEALRAMGETCVGEIGAPGTVEGGDVVLAGDVAFVGRSIRTNEEGIQQLSALLAMMGYEIRVIALPDTILHLDKALMVLGPKQVLYCRELVSEEEIEGFEGIGFSCGGNTTANIICLGDRELIVNSSNSIVIDRLKAEGYVVRSLDLGEFAKGMGGPNCLIMPVER
ncbi:MAG: amidinotransferase [Anaerolineae bacterium]|nr:amidinotransferase [Anaerolineae bacterium]